MSDELLDVNVGTSPESKTIAEIKISVLEDKVVWDIGQLTVPDVVFWLETVRHMILDQVVGGSNVVQSS